MLKTLILRNNNTEKLFQKLSGKLAGEVFIFYIYTGAPVLGTHYIVIYDAEVCGAERESSRMIQGHMH